VRLVESVDAQTDVDHRARGMTISSVISGGVVENVVIA